MKQGLSDAWVEALESGKYRRVVGVLEHQTPAGVSHCCLGVLARVAQGMGYKIEEEDILYRSYLAGYVSGSLGICPTIQTGLGKLNDSSDRSPVVDPGYSCVLPRIKELGPKGMEGSNA